MTFDRIIAVIAVLSYLRNKDEQKNKPPIVFDTLLTA